MMIFITSNQEFTMNSSRLHSGSNAPAAQNGNGMAKLLHLARAPETIGTAAPALEPLAGQPVADRWGLAKRVLFRFTFVYLILYMVPTLLGSASLFSLFLGGPWTWISENIYQPYADVLNPVVDWLRQHLFHIEPKVPGATDWPFLLSNVVLAAAAAAVWSLLDRKRPTYTRLYTWLRVTVCFYLAATMIIYGMAKVIPNHSESSRPTCS